MTPTISSESRTTACSESTLSFHLSYSPSTFTNLSRTITSREFHWAWLDDLLSRYCKHWSIWKKSSWFIAIWSQKIFFWRVQTSRESKWLILDPVASRIRGFTHTFNLDSTEHLKLYWVSLTPHQLICGVLAAFWQNYSLEFRYSLVKANKSSSHLSWKLLGSQTKRSLTKPQGKMSSLTQKQMSHTSNKILKVLWESHPRSL